jgi:hypothetical protein
MNPEEHGRESVSPPPPPDGAPKTPMPGPHPRSEAADSHTVANSSEPIVEESAHQTLAPKPLELQPFAVEPATGRVFGSASRGNLIKAGSAVRADARSQLAAVTDSKATGDFVPREPDDLGGAPSATSLVSVSHFGTARADRNAGSEMQARATDQSPPVPPKEDGRPYILPEVKIQLGGKAQDEVLERCTRRRNCRELKNFPVSAKPAWLDRLFRRYGRILVEGGAQSATDRWRHAWFIGDVHGDLVGLVAALEFIRGQGEYSKTEDIIVLLGDLIDDLPESQEVLAEVSEALGDGERMILIVGNHDDALEHSDTRGFGASVDPCDYCEFLKGIADGGPEHPSLRFAQSFISYMRDAPVALFLSDGTMAAHGGVPHTDLAEQVAGGGWGEDRRVWSDFIWARLHPRAKSRMAVSGTRSRELGAEDFRRFASTVKSHLGFEPARMIRGHDHIDARFEIYGGKWQDSVLTINNMSWKLPRETGVDGPRDPCIARWKRGEPIQPFVIVMDREWRAGMQPRSQA